MQKIDELRQQLNESRVEIERQKDSQVSSQGQLKNLVGKFMEILVRNSHFEETYAFYYSLNRITLYKNKQHIKVY